MIRDDDMRADVNRLLCLYLFAMVWLREQAQTKPKQEYRMPLNGKAWFTAEPLSRVELGATQALFKPEFSVTQCSTAQPHLTFQPTDFCRGLPRYPQLVVAEPLVDELIEHVDRIQAQRV